MLYHSLIRKPGVNDKKYLLVLTSSPHLPGSGLPLPQARADGAGGNSSLCLLARYLLLLCAGANCFAGFAEKKREGIENQIEKENGKLGFLQHRHPDA